MSHIGAPYASGQWTVKAGKEDDFVAQWTEFLEWSSSFDGYEDAVLFRDGDAAQHFLSVSRWKSKDGMEAWRGHAEFRDHIGKCIALCDDFKSFEFTVAAHVEGK